MAVVDQRMANKTIFFCPVELDQAVTPDADSNVKHCLPASGAIQVVATLSQSSVEG